MIFIAHRGNTKGPNPEMENQPNYLYSAIEQGFDVEFDIHLIDGEWWLGHDRPQYPIGEDLLNEMAPYSWIHCKNLAAFEELGPSYDFYNAFWHQTDDYTLTSLRHIWCYPGLPVPDAGIAVVLEDIEGWTPSLRWGGVCSDYVALIRERM